MRGQVRRMAAVAATGAAGLLLAGCSLPDGIDGDLMGGWASMPAPAGWVPEIGVCHDRSHQDAVAMADYHPVDCQAEHTSETVYVGELSDSVAEAAAPPEPATDEWREAYAECDDAAADYLGANFRYAPLWLGVSVPSDDAWQGGSRWFRCDVEEFGDAFETTRAGSLAGALSGDSDLLLGCFEVSVTGDDQIDRMDPIGCGETHQAEFVGVWQAPEGDYLDQSKADKVHAGCRSTVAEYVNVPDDENLQFRTGTIADWMDEEDWNNGDRGFRCYLWLNGNDLNESLEGAGTSALPIQ